MNKMVKVHEGIDVSSLLAQLDAHPELWNANTLRTTHKGSPHSEVSDIWVRYRSWAEFDPTHPERLSDCHESVWYPAYHALPAVRPIIFDLMRMVEGERLGGILITRIPPGGQVHPHADHGWHAGHYDKYAVHLKANEKQSFNFVGESHSARPGDVYWFDNSHTHWVINDSDEDRMTLIICIRSNRES